MYDNFSTPGPKPGSTALRVGILAGIALILIHVAAWLVTEDVGTGDVIGWVVSWLVVFVAARTAADQQYRAQSDAIEPLQGVQGAGIGAALITTFILWLFITSRNLMGSGDAFTNAWGILRIPVDLFIALGLGAWGSRLQAHKDQVDKPFYKDW
jgi:hypothetical protein